MFTRGVLRRPYPPPPGRGSATSLDLHPPDQFLELPAPLQADGKTPTVTVRTRYRMYEPQPSAPAVHNVVMTMGLATELLECHPLAALLAKKGCRVLTYDRYGHGYTDAIDLAVKHDDKLFVSQLRAILTQPAISTELHTPYTFVGARHGGGILLSYTYSYPEDVSQLVLFCSTGMAQPTSKLLYVLCRIPLISSILFKLVLPSVFCKQIDTATGAIEPVHRTVVVACQESIKAWIHTEAGQRTFMAIIRDWPLDLQTKVVRVGEEKRPTLLLWGEDDTVIPVTVGQKMAEVLHGQIVAIKGASHVVEWERTTECYDQVVRFLGLDPAQ